MVRGICIMYNPHVYSRTIVVFPDFALLSILSCLNAAAFTL